jgi:hypothetical protein
MPRASRRSKQLDLKACPTPSSSSPRLCGITDKLWPAWFWGPNQKTVVVILRLKSPNRSCRFRGPMQKPEATGFEAKPGETVDLSFEAKPWNSYSSSRYGRCRLHIASTDLSIVRPPSTRPLLDHPQSSAPDLLLLSRSSSLPAMSHLSPTHHKTSKHDSSHKIDNSRVEPPKPPGFKFKSWQANYSSQSNHGTDHLVSQSPPWWVHWQQKAQSLNFKSKTHETQLEDQKPKKSWRRSSRRRKNRKARSGTKSSKPSKMVKKS